MGESEQDIVSQKVPTDILSYLASDEKLVQTERIKDWKIYLTNKRIILKKGGIFRKELIEASYRHISSIEYKKHRPIKWIIIGIVCIASAFFVTYQLNRLPPITVWIPVILAIAGFALIIAAFLRPAKFRIHIIGRKPIILSGNLEAILKIVREYREN